MLSKNIETFLCCDSGWEEAGHRPVRRPLRLHHLLPARLPGLGSAAIRRESYGVESYSPYQDRDLLDVAVFDSGGH